MTEFRVHLVVASIEETANRFNIPKAFIGLIVLPIVVSNVHVIPRNLTLTRLAGKCRRTRHFRVDGYEGQNGAYYWDLRGQFDCTEYPLPAVGFRETLMNLSANRYIRRSPPCGSWLVVSIPRLSEPVVIC